METTAVSQDSCERPRVEKKKDEPLGSAEPEYHHFLLVVQLPQGTAFLLSSRLDSAVKHYSSEVLVSSGVVW